MKWPSPICRHISPSFFSRCGLGAATWGFSFLMAEANRDLAFFQRECRENGGLVVDFLASGGAFLPHLGDGLAVERLQGATDCSACSDWTWSTMIDAFKSTSGSAVSGVKSETDVADRSSDVMLGMPPVARSCALRPT